jgi:hypothetical protein
MSSFGRLIFEKTRIVNSFARFAARSSTCFGFSGTAAAATGAAVGFGTGAVCPKRFRFGLFPAELSRH